MENVGGRGHLLSRPVRKDIVINLSHISLEEEKASSESFSLFKSGGECQALITLCLGLQQPLTLKEPHQTQQSSTFMCLASYKEEGTSGSFRASRAVAGSMEERAIYEISLTLTTFTGIAVELKFGGNPSVYLT
ncbi:hypothetical protein J6590_027291 [Homalodisca vitripennis]|nr:hypothetical protein J6590_027291 [Homalodisca vitripennis]